jgi:DNA topoisomerase II
VGSHRLTSSNYDDDQKKLTGGRNGYGAKLANIYSLEFSEYCCGVVARSWKDKREGGWLTKVLLFKPVVVETADKNTLKKYKQVFSNNMSVKGKPKVSVNDQL